MALVYPRKIDLAQTPTPLQYLDRASARWGQGHRLWVKRDDLTGCTLSGNKVRKLEFIAAHAIDNHYDTLITCGGLQSNHCRATAFAGAQLGLQVHLLLRGEQPETAKGNFLLDQLAGAAISCYPADDYFRNIKHYFKEWQTHYAEQGHKALVIPTGGSDGIGVWGYIAACEELRHDFKTHGIARANIVTASGSGGTQAGLTAGCVLHEVPAQVWGINVCDDEAYFQRKVAADIQEWQALYPEAPDVEFSTRVLDGHVGAGYGIASSEIFELIHTLAELEGLLLDPVYTGKAFAGLIREIVQGRFEDCEDIVFIHTGGVFGVFPQSDGFNLERPMRTP